MGQPALQDKREGVDSVGRFGRRHFHALHQHVPQHVCRHDGFWLCNLDPHQLYQDNRATKRQLDVTPHANERLERCAVGHRGLCLAIQHDGHGVTVVELQKDSPTTAGLF